MTAVEVDTAIVGGGPAAFGLLRTALQRAQLGGDAGSVCLISGSPAAALGSGRLRDYDITSDTPGSVFVECAELDLPALLGGQQARARHLLETCSTDGPVHLAPASALLELGAAQALDALRELAALSMYTSSYVTRLTLGADVKELVVTTPTGPLVVRARTVVLATGGRPWSPPGMPGSAATGLRCVHSDRVLRGLPADVKRALSASDNPRIVIVGGSHSAFASANALLRLDPSHQWGPGSIRMAHLSPIRMTYPDVTAARADGVDVSPDDVCPATGRVFRFGGLRGDSAQLWTRVRDGLEPRVQLVGCEGDGDVARLASTGLLTVAATGYESASMSLIPEFFDADDPDRKAIPRIDERGRLTDRAGNPVSGAYCIGLGAGNSRPASSGGEPSFHGSVDGVWYYRNVVSAAIADDALAAGQMVGGTP